MDHKATQLRDLLSKVEPNERPEKLIRLCLLYSAHEGMTADQATSIMLELREEFDISESAIHAAIAASSLLLEVWPR
jgi:hypothetical protein